MNITGGTPYNLRLFPQTGVSVYMYTDSMDDCVLRLHGPSTTGNFTFTSGKIYDTSGRFFGAFSSGSQFSFSVAYNTGKYTTWIGSDMYSANQNFANSYSGYLTGFYFSGQRDMSVGLSIRGIVPSLEFSTLNSADGINYTGYVKVNGGYSGYLYSITPDNGTATILTASPFTSGNYTITGLNLGSGTTAYADFAFDFGTYRTGLSLSNPDSYIPSGYITIASTASQTGVDSLSNRVQYQDFVITTTWPNPMSFETYLQFDRREGYTTIYATGNGTGYYSGYISGSGNLTSRTISGNVNTGYYLQLGNQIPTGFSSRVMTGTSQKFFYATGQVVYDYIVPAYAYEQTIFFGWDYCTGYIEGSTTGQVLVGDNGKFVFTGPVTGDPIYYNSKYFLGSLVGGDAANYGYYDVTLNPTSQYLDTSQQYTGALDYTGFAQGQMRFLGTGAFTGQFSGYVYSNSTGLITGFNYYTGESYIQTGDYSYVITSYYNYAANGYRTGGYIKKTLPDSIQSGVYILGARITFDQNTPQDVVDYVNLVVRAYDSRATGIISVTPEGYSI